MGGLRGALILNLSPSRSPFARPSVSLSLSVANKHVTMKQPRRQTARRKKGGTRHTNTLIIARCICVIFELSALREKWIRSTKKTVIHLCHI